MADSSVDGDGHGSGVDANGDGVDTKSLLSDFYGAMLSAPADSEGGDVGTAVEGWADAGVEEEHIHARSSTVRRVDETLDLDSERFQPSLYVEELLRSRPMKDLLDDDARLVQQKRSLDSDMQMLVYENYSKFITATDMIRRMKENVEGMESDMNRLLHNIHDIQRTTSAIEQQLTPNRERVENLVGVSRLLKRLEFLFELPGRLEKSIQLGAYEQAVKSAHNIRMICIHIYILHITYALHHSTTTHPPILPALPCSAVR